MIFFNMQDVFAGKNLKDVKSTHTPKRTALENNASNAQTKVKSAVLYCNASVSCKEKGFKL